MATKIRRELEPRWVAEYVAANYPNAENRPRCPLGPIPTGIQEAIGGDKARRVYRPWRPEVDTCVILPTKLVLIEGKIFKTMDGLSKLPVYKSLIPTTPELTAHKEKPIDMELLVVRPLPWVVQAASLAGIRVVEWAPPWIIQVWEDRDKYWAPEAVKAREERKKFLEDHGFV